MCFVDFLRRRGRRRDLRRAFTLIELLVVIGIIGILTALLLPMITGAQARGRDLKCQSNLRQVVVALFNYAAENKSSMPYGFYFNRSDPITWGPASEPERFISWPSQVARYTMRGASGETEPEFLPGVLRCPEAEQVYPHLVSYAMNMVVAVSPAYELMMHAPPRAQLKPPRTTMLMPDTALLWDTAVQPDWERDVGFLVGLDVDDQRFWIGAEIPQFRYYSDSDPFSKMLGGILGNNKAIRLDVKMYQWRNIDPSEETSMPYQGNLRFRHRKETTCNAGFADGSVRPFTVKLNDDGSLRTCDAIRRQFMIKWPPGVPPDPTRPH